MIARLWQGEVPQDRADAYIALMQEVALPDYAAVPGNLGAWCLHHATGELVKVTMLTFWEDEAAIRSFAGTDISKAKYYSFDPQFLVDMSPTVEHHMVAGTEGNVRPQLTVDL